MGINASLADAAGEGTKYHDIASKRIKNADSFKSAINQFERSYRDILQVKSPIEDHVTLPPNGYVLACRKRPINDKELSLSEFDVLSSGLSLFSQQGSIKQGIWLHKCGFRLDMKHMYVDHHGYEYDAVFDEQDDSRCVFENTAQMFVDRSLSGKDCFIMMFGATGSGKTYTMDSIFQLSADRLFARKPSNIAISFSCVEIAGNAVVDVSSQKEVSLLEDADGTTQLIGCITCAVSTALELKDLFMRAASIRKTHETGVHSASSRSHIIYKISLLNIEETTACSLTLVDLAGSEWSKDQELHSSARIAEAKEINSSLMVLKQCIQARLVMDRVASSPILTSASRIPYRESKLTRILKRSFTSLDASTLVIATVSPASSDTEHTQDVLGLTSLREPRISDARLCEKEENGPVSPIYSVSTASNGGVKVILTNINTLAVLDDDEQAKDSSCCKIEKFASVETCNPCETLSPIELPNDPRTWTSAEVVRWFAKTAKEACEAVQLEMSNSTKRIELVPDEDSSLFTVSMSAKKWVSLRLEGKDSIGLAFDETEGDIGDFPIVSKVLSKGYIKLVKNPRLKTGCFLVAVQRQYRDSKQEILRDLKQALREFKNAVLAIRKYDEDKQKFMTPDMMALRNYILNGPQTLYPNTESKRHLAVASIPGDDKTEVADATCVIDEGSTSSKQELSFASSSETNTSFITEPSDYVLALTFKADEKSQVIITVPEVPRLFTGESRLGEVWAGDDLVTKYALDGPDRFISACNGNQMVGNYMYDSLRKIIGQQQSSLKPDARI